MNTDNTFHLGITMAGAVSAGCYTAGVMDYIFETLNLWEKAKEGKTEIDYRLIPSHNVVIDVMGGASAGGMTTMMSALQTIYGDNNYVSKKLENPYEKVNILYDSWVHLDDSDKETFVKLLDISDLEKEGELKSILNSNSIDNIANNAFKYFDFNNPKYPSYISRELEVLLSHTIINGIPLEVDFSSFKGYKEESKPRHTSFEHQLVSHYKLNSSNNEDSYLKFDPNDSVIKEKMKLTTISTGAFPIGLKYREFNKDHFSVNYIRNSIKRSLFGDFSSSNPDPNNDVSILKNHKEFSTLTVDGGAVNNEPYSEVLSIVRREARNIDFKYGVIMIDPFPDMNYPNLNESSLKTEESVFEVGIGILKTLKEQSKVKRKEMVTSLEDKFIKGQIYPRRNYYDDSEIKTSDPSPIASASLGAFGGFLDINFRVHDFHLGRDNARNFLRYFFSMPIEKYEELFGDLSEESKNIFGFKNKYDDEKIYFPLIPDFRILNHYNLSKKLTDTNVDFINENKFRLSSFEFKNYTISKKPQLNGESILKYKVPLTKRISKILIILEKKYKNQEKNIDSKSISTKIIESHYKTNLIRTFFKSIGTSLLKVGYNLFKQKISNKITKSILVSILKDLEKNNLLKKP